MKAKSKIVALIIATISIITLAGCSTDASSIPTTSVESIESNNTDSSSTPSIEEESSKQSSNIPTTSSTPSSNYSPTPNNKPTSSKPHTHSYGEWVTTKVASCTTAGTQERSCLCGHKETQTTSKTEHTVVKDAAVAATCTKTGLTEGSHCSVCNTVIVKQNTIAKANHNFNNGKCSSCGASDPNYKTPDLVLGAYIQQNGTKQSDGKYVISKTDSSANIDSITQIYWDPVEQSLIFAEQSTTSTGSLIAGIIFEYGSNQQKITVINQVINSKFTGIGYIYADTYSVSNDTIQWLNCECTYPSLISNNQKTSESAIWLLMSHTSDFLREINIGVNIRDLGFVEWIG